MLYIALLARQTLILSRNLVLTGFASAEPFPVSHGDQSVGCAKVPGELSQQRMVPA